MHTWFLLLTRSWYQHSYYIRAARQIEENLLPNFVTTVSDGNELSKGNEVIFQLKEEVEPYKIPRRGKLKVSYSSNFIFVIFISIYLYLLRKDIICLIGYLIGGRIIWNKWLQAAPVILALGWTLMLAFGLRVKTGIDKKIRKQIGKDELISPSEVVQRKGWMILGLTLILIAAFLQLLIIFAF